MAEPGHPIEGFGCRSVKGLGLNIQGMLDPVELVQFVLKVDKANKILGQ